MPSLTIIGMGACGAAAFVEATIRLAAAPVAGMRIDLVERDAILGPGLAFGTDQPGHLLNTESRLMGLLAHEPGHFRNWLAARRPLDPDGVEYAPRGEYGDYVQQLLDDAFTRADAAGIAVHVHRGEAIAVEGGRDDARIRLADGTVIAADHVLLALGTPQPERFAHLDGLPGYYDFPWPAARLREGIDRDADVTVLGSSLSAIDTLMTLLDVGHRGRVRFVSKDGMLPRVEIPAPEQGVRRTAFTLAEMHRRMRRRGRRFTIVDLFRMFRADVDRIAAAPVDWDAEDRMGHDALHWLAVDIARAQAGAEPFQRVLTDARHEASAMWDLLGPRDRTRFGRWLAPHFATARFTMPMVNARRMQAAADAGQLSVHGRVEETTRDAASGDFISRLADGTRIASPVLVNATGTAMTIDEMPDAIVRQLADRGWIHAHPSGGIVAHRHSGAVYTADRNAPRLYAIGQLVNGVQRDTNAVWFNVQCAERTVADILGQIADAAR